MAEAFDLKYPEKGDILMCKIISLHKKIVLYRINRHLILASKVVIQILITPYLQQRLCIICYYMIDLYFFLVFYFHRNTYTDQRHYVLWILFLFHLLIARPVNVSR